ncbi:uncharacterized protein LOC144145046 isoform X2 [Haemaphysalis longicornis]
MDGVVTVQPPRSTSDPMLAVGDCLQSSRSPKKFDQPHRTSSLVVSTTQSPYHRGYPDTATDEAADTHPDGNDSPLLGCEDTFVHDEKAHFEKGAHRGEPLGVDSPGTSSSCESVELPTGWSQREYVLRAQAVFETYWKSNVHNVLEVLKELSERGVAELGWKRQGKLQEFTKTVSRVWQRVGEQVTGLTGEMLPHLDAQSASSRPEFMAHELLPLLMRICEVWWLTQRQVASHFIALHQKYDNSSEHWLMALREVDIHLLRTSILHREIMASELRKLVKAADRELEASGCTLHAIFLKEGIGHWLAENLDLIWCEFGNQVQKGVVSLYKAETYRATIDILDQALGTSTTEDGSASVGSEIGGALSTGSLTQSAPASHTKVTVMVTKIWEGVMSEMRQCFKECRARFEEAILTDHRL